jgi:tripartite-type tricarboxylate transporter receptor subunit TctC
MPTALPQSGSHRLKYPADVPTVAESGLPGFVLDNWYGVAVPRGTPPAIIDRLHALIAQSFSDPALVDRFAQQGAEITLTSAQQFGQLVRDDTKRWTEVSRAAGIKPE